MNERTRNLDTLVGASIIGLFFLSGATSLAYQGIWFRRLTATWGSSSLAMAAVVSSFLIGLAIGAFIAGRLARRIARPLEWYGILEVCIGIWALLVPPFISWVSDTSLGTLSSLPSSPLLLFVVRSIIAFLIIGFPCICMGATLPLLVDFRCRQHDAIGRATALLYGVNTLGASVGCYLTGFHLLPVLGSAMTNLAVALGNIAVGVGVFVASRLFFQMQSLPATGETEVNEHSSRDASPTWVFAAAAVTGCAALILEMVWARQLALILGGSTYVFTATLCIVLLGIAIGSLLYIFVEGYASTQERLLDLNISVIFGVCALTVVGQSLIPAMCRISGSLRGLRDSEMSNGLICAAIAVALELGAAIGMGILFPALVAAAKRNAVDSANVVGSLYLWNTVGSALGAVIASSLLIPLLGTVWTITLAIFGYLCAAVLLEIQASSISSQRVLVTGILGAAIAFALIRMDDPLVSNLGMYLYGPEQNPSANVKLVYFQEGQSCNVLVTETANGNRALRVNGKVDASTGSDQIMQLGCAYLPRFLRPSAKTVCVIGLGSGATSGASLLFPETIVTCFEIEPAVYEAARHFSQINHSPWASSRFQIVFDDARSAMKRSRDEYDLILSEPSNPWMAGVSGLYTQEFYRTAKRHLRPDGIVAQWIQTYNFSQEEFNLILRTIQSVFPRVGLLRISRGDTIVVASAGELDPRAQELDSAQRIVNSSSEISSDLTDHFGTSDVRGLLLRHFVLDGAGVERLRAGETDDVVNTDINMRLEFDAPHQLFRLPTRTTQDVAVAIDRVIRPTWFEACIEKWECSHAQTSQLADLCRSVVASEKFEGLEQLIKSCRRIDPNERFFQIVERVFDEESDVEVAPLEPGGRMLSERMADTASQIGVGLWRQKRYGKAAHLFSELVVAFPQSATLWMNLAVNYSALGHHEDAAQAARRAMSIDPINEYVQQKGSSISKSRLENQPGGAAEIPDSAPNFDGIGR